MKKLVEAKYLTTNKARRGRLWFGTSNLKAMAFKRIADSPDVVLGMLESTLKLYPNLSDYKKPFIEKMVAAGRDAVQH